MARAVSVAVLGLGSRGLSVLERIVTLARKAGPTAGQVRIELVDPLCDGAGVHAVDQPDYLLLNTICSHVSMFPDGCTVGEDVDRPGPNLYEWVTERGLRIGPDGFTVSTHGRPIRPIDFLPRRVLGEYLGWFLAQVLDRAPEHVRITRHRAAAVDLTPAGPDGELAITLSDGTAIRTGHAFLTTGYTANTGVDSVPGGHQRVITAPYPLPARVAEVRPGQSVAISGFGLSAMDLMSCLTAGRGGRFTETGGGHRYLPSGDEPTIFMYSRSGVPCRARPLFMHFGPTYHPLAFTTEAIDRLRTERGGQLDFDADLLPLVLTEMRIAYRRCEARCAGGDAERVLVPGQATFGGFSTALATPITPPTSPDTALERELADAAGEPGDLAGLTALLDKLDARLGTFDAAATFDGAADLAVHDTAAYQRWFTGTIAADLADGRLGFPASPVKAALDVCRELRDTFRYAVDFGGLTDASLGRFNRHTVPLLNRAVVGPQFERHSELLALIEAGVAQVPFGPAPAVAWNGATGRWTISSTTLTTPHSAEVDWLVAANVAPPAVETSASPLISALHRGGWIRRHRPASGAVHGIDVTADLHPVRADGEPERRLWVLGPLCEGATFYNHLVPSPNVYSRPVFDAHRCAAALLADR